VFLAVPVVASTALVLAACGGGGNGNTVAQQSVPVSARTNAAPAGANTATGQAPSAATPAGGATTSTTADAPAAPVVKSDRASRTAGNTGPAVSGPVTRAAKPAPAKAAAAVPGGDSTVVHHIDNGAQAAANQKIYDQKGGATEVGVTKDSVKLGSINMHGMALGNIITAPQVRGNQATASAVNDRGGVLGRRILITDCDDGPGEVSRAKACIKKLVDQDKVFSLVTGVDWATASIHDDLKQYHLPYIGAWAYSQTEWQDPFMFPTHMSMIHESMAGAHWAVDVIKPKTYGLICLTSPEMQLACNNVEKIVSGGGAKMVKRADVSISETSMSSYVLAMRAANPEHIIHYVINPATVAKWMVESAQQGYYPPKGISGNHLAGEVVGSLIGQWPAGRYWTNTTYKLWGNEYMATMNKYARANRGTNHHIVQAGYVGINVFALAAKAVGPNLTRDRLMTELDNGTVWASDASLDQRFAYVSSERTGDNWNRDYGQGREFMYKYNSTDTLSSPDGSPNGWTPDPNEFVLHTNG